MSSTEEEADCPICCNELDLTDRSIQYCSCGFQPCLWCYHHILEEATKENLPARCPNCRSEYDQNKISMQHIDAEQLEEEKRKLKEKDKPKGIGGPTSRIPRAALTNVRVVQPNLVYAVGISMEICHEDVLKDVEFFGQFGKTVKISVNRSNQYASAMARHGPTGSAYVTFKRAEDALRCIKMIDGNLWRGKPVKACFGTTKYCNAFLKGVPCNNPDCLYLHELADDADCLTKEEVAAGLLPARFLAMGATNTFKPRLTINLIPNAQTAAAQAAAAAAAAAGQPPAAIQAAAAAAGGISRAVPSSPGGTGGSHSHSYQQHQQHFSQHQQQQQQPPPPPSGTAPRVLTIPVAGRAASHGSLQHQDSNNMSSGYGGSGGGYGGGYNGEMDSPGRSMGGYSGYSGHHNELESHPEPSPPRGLWASAAAAGASAGGAGAPPLASQPSAAAVPPPPPSDKQEWPTLAAAPSNASLTTMIREDSINQNSASGAAGAGGGGGLGRMPSMAEQLARAHSNPAEAKTARQPKKLLPLSSPGKLKTLGKAVQRPGSPLDLQMYRQGSTSGGGLNATSSGGLGSASTSSAGGLGVGAIGQGIVELNLGHPARSTSSNLLGGNALGPIGGGGMLGGVGSTDLGKAPSTAATTGAGGNPLLRGPPPGFGSSSVLGGSTGLAPPGFPGAVGGGGGGGGGGASGHSSFDSLGGNIHNQQWGNTTTTATTATANGNGPSTYSPFVGGSVLFDPATTLGAAPGGSGGGGSGSGSGSGVQRQRSRFAFANAEEEAASAGHMMHNSRMGQTHLGGSNLSSSGMMMPSQQQQQHPGSSMLHPSQQQHQQQQQQLHNTPGSPSPQDASAFFKSLFPTANINIAAVSPQQQQQGLNAPPGFSSGGGVGMGGNSPLGGTIHHQQQQQHGYLNNTSSVGSGSGGMFPFGGAGNEQVNGPAASNAGLAPGLALLRQLQGGSVSPHTSTGGDGGGGGGGGGSASGGSASGGAQQPPPGFGMRM